MGQMQISVEHSYMPMRESRAVRDLGEDRHPRWTRNEPARVRFLLEKFGYRVEYEDGKVKAGVQGDYTKGAITSGNDILLSCSKEEYEARQELRNKAAIRYLDGPRETFKTEGLKSGVKVDDNTKRYAGTLQDGMTEKS